MEQKQQLSKTASPPTLTPLATLEQKVEYTLRKWHTPNAFMVHFSPLKLQTYTSTKLLRQRCIIGTAPQLYVMSVAYGEAYPIQWLMALFVQASEFSGAKDKITPYQLEKLARKFYERYSYLKASEVMLFIEKLESADFGRFSWSAFDPVSVLEKVEDFLVYKGRVEDEYHQQLREERERNHHPIPPPKEILDKHRELLLKQKMIKQ